MTDRPGEAPFGLGMHPEAASLLAEHFGSRMEQDSGAVAIAYSEAMPAGQLFEFAAKLAEPATSVNPQDVNGLVPTCA